MSNAAPAALGPRPADPTAPAPTPQWTITTTEGLTASGYQPPWSFQDPTEHDVPLERLAARLRDVLHWTAFPGEPLLRRPDDRPDHAADSEDAGDEAWETDDGVFVSTIECRPYDENPARRVPTAGFHLTETCWMNGLTPQDLTDLAAQLRHQADALEHRVLPALAEARREWNARTRRDSSPSPAASTGDHSRAGDDGGPRKRYGTSHRVPAPRSRGGSR